MIISMPRRVLSKDNVRARGMSLRGSAKEIVIGGETFREMQNGTCGLKILKKNDMLTGGGGERISMNDTTERGQGRTKGKMPKRKRHKSFREGRRKKGAQGIQSGGLQWCTTRHRIRGALRKLWKSAARDKIRRGGLLRL